MGVFRVKEKEQRTPTVIAAVGGRRAGLPWHQHLHGALGLLRRWRWGQPTSFRALGFQTEPFGWVPSQHIAGRNNFGFHSCLVGKTSLQLPVRFRICLPDKGMSAKTIFPLGRQNTDGGVRSLTIFSCYIDGRDSAAWMLTVSEGPV